MVALGKKHMTIFIIFACCWSSIIIIYKINSSSKSKSSSLSARPQFYAPLQFLWPPTLSSASSSSASSSSPSSSTSSSVSPPPACKIPKIDPFDPSVSKYFSYEGGIYFQEDCLGIERTKLANNEFLLLYLIGRSQVFHFKARVTTS